MDVASGSKHVPIHPTSLNSRTSKFFALISKSLLACGLACVLVFMASNVSTAMEEKSPMQWSSTKTLWDRKQNVIFLKGDAVVRQPGEQLTAENITLDREKNTLVAKGNCVYITGSTLVLGEGMDFDLSTRTGTVMNGRVSGDNFLLSGERINKLGANRYQVYKGAYTTCLDCAQSWTIRADDVDVEIEGYAYMRNVSIFIKDAPVIWLPYLIIPVKTHRQTGLLFPKFGFATLGFRYVQPFFWAINRSTDMTFALGDWGGQGLRAEWEGRYALSDRSYGQLNFWMLRDSHFPSLVGEQYKDFKGLNELPTTRFAIDAAQRQELPFGIDEKIRIREVRDNLYPFEVGDVGGIGDAYLSSDFILSKSVDGLSGYITARRTRNLTTSDPVAFDPKTVQVYPSILATTNDRFIGGSRIATGFSLGVTRFDRVGSTFDDDPFNPNAPGANPRLGQDPIRKATRVFYTPSVYTTFRPFGALSVVPQAEYRGYFYSFPDQIPSLSRGYLLLKTDLSLQLEKIYDTNDPQRPRVKHLIRPILSYSVIPRATINEDQTHPFIRQMNYARQNSTPFTGYNFDSQDIVPLESSQTYSSYFTPLGNSLSYGFVSQLITRAGETTSTSAGYETNVELNATQTYNFQELSKAWGRRPFSRMISNLIFSYQKWNWSTQYVYVPYVPNDGEQDPHIFSTSFSYTFDKTVHQNILQYERSMSLGFSRSAIGSRTSNLIGTLIYSLNDYIQPVMTFSKDFVTGRWLSITSQLVFQSPSQCWKLSLNASRQVGPCPNGYCFVFGPDLSINLSGSNFGGLTEGVSPIMGPAH